MIEPTYRQALAGAWKFVWHNKILWIFGLLAAMAGQFGINNFLAQLSAVNAGRPLFWLANIPWDKVFTGWNWLWFSWLGILILAIVIILILAAVGAQGALIAAASGLTGRWFAPNLGRAWHRGVKHFWRLLGINLIKRALLILILLFTGFGFFQLGNLNGNLLYIGLIIFLTLALFLALSISTASIFASGYAIVEETNLWRSITKGWKMYTKHFLVSIELAVILFFFELLLVIAIMSCTALALLPSVILSLVAGFSGKIIFLSIGTAISGFVLILLIGFCGAIYNSFTISAWTILFMKMRREGIISRLAHWVGGIMKR